MLGSILAAGFYKFIKALEYETANPGQDASAATEKLAYDDHADATHAGQSQMRTTPTQYSGAATDGSIGQRSTDAITRPTTNGGTANEALVDGEGVVKRFGRGSSYAA